MTGSTDVRIWPNLLSLVRLPLAGWFVLADSTPVRGAILVIAALTDWLDGRLARRFGGTSRLGEMLDPIADKIFVGVVLVTFTWEGALTGIEFGVLLARDTVVLLGVFGLTAAGHDVRLPARMSGKITTNLQLLTVVVLLLAPSLASWAVMLVAPFAVWAIVDYSRAGYRATQEEAARLAADAVQRDGETE